MKELFDLNESEEINLLLEEESKTKYKLELKK